MLMTIQRRNGKVSVIYSTVAGSCNVTTRDGSCEARYGAWRPVLGVLHPSVGGMSCTGSLLIIINYLFHCIILYLGLFC
jgi:hypothetical protein